MPSPTGQTDSATAEDTIIQAIRRGVVSGGVVLQAAALPAVIGSTDVDGWGYLLLVPHLLLAILGLACLRRRGIEGWLVAGLFLIIQLDMAAVSSRDSVLAFTAVWEWNLAHVAPVILLTGWPRVVAVLFNLLVAPVLVYLIHPNWGIDLSISAFGTGAAMVGAGWVAMWVMRGMASRADRETERVGRLRRAVLEEERSAWLAQEAARALHDTVINTFNAIAAARSWLSHEDRLRERCVRDLRTVASIRDGGDEWWTEVSGREILEDLDLIAPMDRAGLTDSVLIAELDKLEDDVAASLRGVLREAALNAVKHAPDSLIQLRSNLVAGRLTVTVSDRGTGIGRDVGYGLAESVLARADAFGLDVKVQSSGSGTAVSVTMPNPTTGEDDTDSADDLVGFFLGMRRRTALLWGVGVAAVGVVIGLINHRELTAEHLMATGLLAVLALVWRVGADAEEIPTALAFVVVLAGPFAYLCGGAAVDFGADRPELWQALGPSVSAVLLLSHRASRIWSVASLVLTGLTAGAFAWQRASDGLDQAALPLAAVVPAVVLVVGWSIFHEALVEIGHQVAADRRRTEAARDRLVAQRAAERALARWRQAGLRNSSHLLSRLAIGEARPDDPAVKAECAREESYLRQLILLSSQSTYLTKWLHRTVVRIRERDAAADLRLGNSDLPDAASASQIGKLLLDVADRMPAGSNLVISQFEGADDSARIGLVGPESALMAGIAEWQVPDGHRLEVRAFGDEALVEVHWHNEGAEDDRVVR